MLTGLDSMWQINLDFSSHIHFEEEDDDDYMGFKVAGNQRHIGATVS